MKTKITLILLGLGLLSGSALAGSDSDVALPTASEVNLTAPNQEGSWSFGAQANYFEPSSNFNYYAIK